MELFSVDSEQMSESVPPPLADIDNGSGSPSWSGVFGDLRQPTHFYTCGMETPSFRWDSDAPEHLYGETLDPLEKTLALPSKAGTSVERG